MNPQSLIALLQSIPQFAQMFGMQQQPLQSAPQMRPLGAPTPFQSSQVPTGGGATALGSGSLFDLIKALLGSK